jgi:hypothetical protein
MITVSNGIDREIQANRMRLARQEIDQMAEAAATATAYLKHVFGGRLLTRTIEKFGQLAIQLFLKLLWCVCFRRRKAIIVVD